MAIPYREEVKRKLVHLSSLWMVAATLLLARWRFAAAAVFLALLLLTLVSEHDYANGGKYLGRLYGRLFGRMLRQETHPGQWIVSGGAPVLAAALLVNLLFPPWIAAGALAVMLVGDAAAALIGRKFGRHQLVNGKSLEGCVGFLVCGGTALAVVLALTGQPASVYAVALAATLAGTLTELFQPQLRLDDNLAIPLAVGAVLRLGVTVL